MMTAQEAYNATIPNKNEEINKNFRIINSLIKTSIKENKNSIEYLLSTSLDNVTNIIIQLRNMHYNVEISEKTDTVNLPGKTKYKMTIKW